MIVLCQDGKYYQNPIWSPPRALIQVNEDGVYLVYVGKVKWTTAVKILRPCGIRAVLDQETKEPTLDSNIIDGKFGPVSIFNIRLTAPPPTPMAYKSLVFATRPLVDEPILDFKKVRKCNRKPTPDS